MTTAASTTTTYDAVPYPSAPMSQTHPARLATVATLFGMKPPPMERCRVLELGCADAGNILGMAAGLPESKFVGVDLSARHIVAGQATAEAAEVHNVTLRQMSILDVPADLGAFDYIICHGVYSWVPAPVRDKILAICREHLTENGVAYVSYNVYPGWHARGMVREMMRYHTRNLSDPQTCTAQARELLAFLVEAVPAGQGAYAGLLKEEQDRLAQTKDSYIFHEHLEENNEPVYFHQFAERAERAGLQYLGEADIASMFVRRIPPAVQTTLAKLGGDVIGREQYLDFFTNRMFRQTLLVRREVTLRREIGPEQLVPFRIASRARPVSERADLHSDRIEEFRTSPAVSISTGHPISKSAFAYLGEVWPQSVPFDELQATARARLVGNAVVVQDTAAYAHDTRLLAESLLHAFTANVVQLHVHEPSFVTEPSERPRASGLARYQAGEGTRVTNTRQELVNLDLLTCHLVRHLDGTRDRAALVEILVQAVAENNIVLQRYGRPVTDPGLLRDVIAQELDSNLRRLGRTALLVG
jgi:methyltransferase-like protein/SAM-dependent methyltransferase